MSKENMKLWNAVCETDPAHTKRVNQRGGFTAIDAMYQVQSATAQFGPVGVGWGWDYNLIFEGGTVIADVALWHGKPEQVVRQVGQKTLAGNGRVDEDAVKKAVTDGLTKCLSYLGFNADVFLGRFDDNKYVAEMEKKHQDEAAKLDEAKKTQAREDKAREFTEALAKALKDANEFKAKIDHLNKASVALSKLSPYPEAKQIAVEAIEQYCFSQYRHMLDSLNSRNALFDMFEAWDGFRKIVTNLDNELGNKLAAMEDEIASKFPAAEAAE